MVVESITSWVLLKRGKYYLTMVFEFYVLPKQQYDSVPKYSPHLLYLNKSDHGAYFSPDWYDDAFWNLEEKLPSPPLHAHLSTP